MAQVAARLIFWKPSPGHDTVETGKQLAAGSVPAALSAIDTSNLLVRLRASRGFARLAIRGHHFFVENARAEAALEGDVHDGYLDVRFYGSFEALAKPLFQFMTGHGLICYAHGDRELLSKWPAFKEPEIDRGYAARMQRVLERHNQKVREQEPDPNRRAKAMNAFVKSEQFRDEMAREYDLEMARERGAAATVDVLLMAAGEKKMEVIRVIRRLTGMELREAKKLVDAAPNVVLAGVRREKAERVCDELEALGARVELR